MVCPKCKGKTTVTDVTNNTDTNETLRKKKCLVCGHQFHTLEFEVEFDERFKIDWIKHSRHYKYLHNK